MNRRGSGNFILYILIIAVSILCSNSTQLSINLRPYNSFCFTQDMPRHTLMTIQVSSGNIPFRVQVMYLRTMIQNITSTGDLKRSFTTQKYGMHRICIVNQAQQYNTLTFQFLVGIHAKDYSSHTENSDYIGSIQNQARIAEIFINQIAQQNRQGLEIMARNEVLLKNFSVQYFFTAIFVGIIMGLSYTQFKIVRNHMINRKYI